jgi:hypothetical protein
MHDDDVETARQLTPTARTKVRRKAERGRYDWETITRVLDEGLVAHVGFLGEHGVCVLPMAYGRIDDRVYLHGAVGNAMLRALTAGSDVCITVTLLDGIVLSRSAFHHSMNYRSVVVVGQAAEVTDPAEREAALLAVVDHVMPGRSDDCRGPSETELRSTRVLRVPLAEASAKVRAGSPIEEPDDLALRYWAGELPLRLTVGEPIADDYVPEGTVPPRYERLGIA